MKESVEEEQRQTMKRRESSGVRDEDNNTLKLNQGVRINLMFYAAADGEKKTSIVFDLFIILEITSNTHTEE